MYFFRGQVKEFRGRVDELKTYMYYPLAELII
jgi:hypothetical protein